MINHWLRRQVDKKCPLIFSSIWILLMLISSIRSTILANASFWEKRAAIHKLRRPFNCDLQTNPPRTILWEVSRVSSLILRANPWLAKTVLRHGNRFAARVRRRYFRRERSDDRKCVCCSRNPKRANLQFRIDKGCRGGGKTRILTVVRKKMTKVEIVIMM